MLQQCIRQYGRYKFAITYPALPKFILRINFEPIVETFGMETDGLYSLVHWQARPRGDRRWGVFCRQGEETSYRSFSFLDISHGVNGRGVQIDEDSTLFVPTAVIWYPRCVVDEAGMIFLKR